MNKIFLLLVIALCYNNNIIAQTLFQKGYGGNLIDIFRSVEQTTDGGYIVIGITYSFGDTALLGNINDMYLLKTNAQGDTIWTKTYGGFNAETGYFVQQTSDGGYIFTGHAQSFGGGVNGDAYLVRTNSNGDTLWTKVYETTGTNPSEWGRSVHQVSGGFVVGGRAGSGAGHWDFLLMKVDNNGNLLWNKKYGGVDWDDGYSMQPTTDGGYIIAGLTKSYGAGAKDVYVVKTDANGNVIWNKTYGGMNDDIAYFIQQTTDGGYIITGSTKNAGAGIEDAFLIKTNANGDTLWTKTYGDISLDVGTCVQQTTDGGYILSGLYGDEYVYMIKTTANGDTLWTKKYGNSGYDLSYSVRITTDGGYILAGTGNGIAGVGNDGYLLKLDANGNSKCSQYSTNTKVGTTAFSISSGNITNTGLITKNTTTVVSNTTTIVKDVCPTCNVLASFTASDSLICTNDIVNFTNTSSGAATYTWKENNVPFGTAVNTSRTFLSAGNYTIVLSADSLTCKDIDTINIIVVDIPTITISGLTDICGGNSTILTASGGINYLWNTGDTTAKITLSPSSTNTYFVIAYISSCADSDSVTVTVNTPPVVSITNSPVSCSNYCDGEAIANVTGGAMPYTYLWNDIKVQTDIVATGLCKGNYFVTVQDSNGCIATDTTTIQDLNYIKADFTFNRQLATTSESTIFFSDKSIGAITTWQWTFFDTDEVSQLGNTNTPNSSFQYYSQVGIYSVKLEVTDSVGCTDDTIQNVRIEGEYFIYIPSAFTPNGDNVNDTFTPKGIGINPNHYKLYIFNRWGELIFQSNSWKEQWDGTVNRSNQKVQEGVYIWKIVTEEETLSKEKHEYIGHVTVIK